MYDPGHGEHGPRDPRDGPARRTARVRVLAALVFVLVGAGLLTSAVFAGVGPFESSAVVEVRGLSISEEGRQATVSIALTKQTPARAFTLSAPPRLVIDLPGAQLALGEGDLPAETGLIGHLDRSSAEGRVRLVFALAAEAKVVASEVGGGWKPHLEVRVAADETMGSTSGGITAGHLRGSETTGAIAAPVPPATPARPVVVVDPGHGGADVGTRSPATGLYEKTVVLDMAGVLIRELKQSGRYDVRTTRAEDVYIPLDRRVTFAREAKADLFVSIHADAEYDHSVRGATIYTVAEKASDAEAAALAAKENAADALAGHVVPEVKDEVGDILAELTLRETRRFSLLAARDILEEYRRHGRLVKGEAHRQAGLRVLRAHDVPSVLVEIGFLSNKEDEALMTSDTWRKATAQSLVRAIDRFFAERGVPGAARAAEK